MTGLDTNVVVRLLTQDDPEQAGRARRALEKLRDRGEPAWIGVIVVCEVVRVLKARYGFGRGEIAGALRKLLHADPFVVEEAEIVGQALDRWEAGRGDLADYLIGLRNEAAGCESILTFDRALKGEPGFAEP